MEKERNYTFKILYALGMIFVVAGHCGNGGISLAYEWFPPYAFHLGLFMFCSGYFYKDEAENRKGNYIWKKTKTLLLPLYFWNIFYAIFVFILSFKEFTIGGNVNWYKIFVSPINNGHQFAYNMGGWFVIPLFMVQLYNVFARALCKKLFKKLNEYLYFIVNLALGVLGVHLASIGYNTGWWLVLVRMLYFIPFYDMGILYRRKLEQIDKIPNIIYFGAIFVLQSFIIGYYGETLSYTPSWCNDFTETPIMPYIVGFIGIAFWLRIAKVFEPSIGRSYVVNLIADNTYFYAENIK